MNCQKVRSFSKNGPYAIATTVAYFNTLEKIHGFGDCSHIMDELGPFRDGLAAQRIGNYIYGLLLQGYEQGLDKESIMKNTDARYRKEWGDDKSFSS
jgi:hypothetical protein